jgi:hypothetical protein
MGRESFPDFSLATVRRGSPDPAGRWTAGLQPGFGPETCGQPRGKVRRPCHNLVRGCEDSGTLFLALKVLNTWDGHRRHESAQELGHRDACDLRPRDDEGDLLAGPVNFAMAVAERFRWTTRARVHLNLPVNEVDDPVASDSSSPVDARNHISVIVEAGVRHLDDESDIGRLGIARDKVANLSPSHHEVRLRHACAARDS